MGKETGPSYNEEPEKKENTSEKLKYNSEKAKKNIDQVLNSEKEKRSFRDQDFEKPFTLAYASKDERLKIETKLENVGVSFDDVDFYEENPETNEIVIPLKITEDDLVKGKKEEAVIIDKNGKSQKVILDDTAQIAYDSATSEEGENMIWDDLDDRNYLV